MTNIREEKRNQYKKARTEQPIESAIERTAQSPLLACQHCACEAAEIDIDVAWIRALLCNQSLHQSANQSKFLVNLAPLELIDLIAQWRQHYEHQKADTDSQSIGQTNLRLYHYLVELSRSNHIRAEIAKEVEKQLDQLHQTITQTKSSECAGFLIASIESCQQICRTFTVNGHARIKPKLKSIHPSVQQAISQLATQSASQANLDTSAKRLTALNAFYFASQKCESFNPTVNQTLSQPIKEQQAQFRQCCVNMMMANPEPANLSIDSSTHQLLEQYATAVWAIGSDRLIDLLHDNDELSAAFLTHTFAINQSTNPLDQSFSRTSTFLLSQSRFFDLSVVAEKLHVIVCSQIKQSLGQCVKWGTSYDDLVNQSSKQLIESSKVDNTLSKFKVVQSITESLNSLSASLKLSQLIEKLPFFPQSFISQLSGHMLITLSIAAHILCQQDESMDQSKQTLNSVCLSTITSCLRVLLRMQLASSSSSINQSTSVLLLKLSSVMEHISIEASFELSHLALRLVRTVTDQSATKSFNQLAVSKLAEVHESNSSLLWTGVAQSTTQAGAQSVTESVEVTDQSIIDVCQQLLAIKDDSSNNVLTIPVTIISKVLELNGSSSTDRSVNQSFIRFAFFFIASSSHLKSSLIAQLQSICLSIIQRASTVSSKKRKRDAKGVKQTVAPVKIDILPVLLHLRAIFECSPSGNSMLPIVSRLVLRAMIQASNQNVSTLINAAICSSLGQQHGITGNQTLSDMSLATIDASQELHAVLPTVADANFSLATLSTLINLAADYSVVAQASKAMVNQPKVFSHSQIDFASHCTRLFAHPEHSVINVRVQQAALTFLAIACRQVKTFFLGDLDATRILHSINDARNHPVNQSLINDLVVGLLDHRSSLAWSRAPLLIAVCQRQLKLLAKQAHYPALDEYLMSLARALTAFARDSHSTPVSHYAPALIADVLVTVHELSDSNTLHAIKQHLMPAVFTLMAVCPEHLLDSLLVQTHQTRQDMFKKWRREYASDWMYRG